MGEELKKTVRTSIQITQETLNVLKNMKKYPRETYDELLIRKLIKEINKKG